jgi:hypothetical protein
VNIWYIEVKMFTHYTEGGRSGRAWIDELPELGYGADGFMAQDVEIRTSQLALAFKAAAELRFIAGPMCPYGALGAEYTPNGSGCLTIRIDTCNVTNRPYVGTLALTDQVLIGLPSEYADGVMTGVMRAANHLPRPGLLHFGWAAHGLIGSSAVIFERLATLVVTLLSQNTDTALQIAIADPSFLVKQL